MKRLLILLAILTVFGAPSLTTSVMPVLAQEATADPAAYLPTNTSAYLEIRADDAALATFDLLINRIYGFSGVSVPAEVNFADTVGSIFPVADFRTDVLPWLADRFALAMAAPPVGVSPGDGDFAFVLPIGDSAGARAFVQKFAARSAERDSLPGGIEFYYGGLFSMAVSNSNIWFGSPKVLKQLLPGSGGTLAQTIAYQQVRAALPADALVAGYVSGLFITETVAAQQTQAAPDFPTADVLWQAALRLHPAQSAAEDALLQLPGLNGIGFALQASADRLDLTTALGLDAHYPAPTLATTTAGAALLSLIPGDSFVVFDSYDLSLVALPVAGLVYLGPAVGNVFSNIVSSLQLNPAATPTPTPTPTPAPPITADTIIAQVQPFIAQAESLMGMSLAQLNSLTGGEYAVAVFPGAGPTIGAALYLHSDDPQRLLDTIDHVSKLILTDPTNLTPLVAVEHKTIDGLDVTLLGTPGAGDRPALGIVADNVLFLTLESTVSKVIAAARSQNSPSPALDWRAAFGDAQEALLYVDPRIIDLYTLGSQRYPPLPLTAVAASFDVRDDGLFVLNLTATLSGE